jgi:hypothetical protein
MGTTDADSVENVPPKKNIESLGFKLTDIKAIIVTIMRIRLVAPLT